MPLRQGKYLRDRFIAIGVSKNLASQMVCEVSRWVEGSGQEWTVNRLKILKTAFLRRIAGESYTLPYVATRKDTLGPVPKGPFGVLWKNTDSSSHSISVALNCMMVYSTMTAESVTPKQWEKFHQSMTRPQPEEQKLRAVVDCLRVPKWMRVDHEVKLMTFAEFVVSRGYSPEYVGKALTQFLDGDTGMALWNEFPQYKQSFSPIAREIDSLFGWDDMFNYHPVPNSRTTWYPVGRLGCTQEPGYKLRVFADPNICHQLALSRMKGQLFRLLRRVKWDCTYNQEDGISWLKLQLDQGRRIWSIDLSDATNNFPLDVQTRVLQEIGVLQEDIELFHRLARAPWSTTHGKQQRLRWTVGQPLGLGPSFAAFALTHGVLVHSLALGCQVTDAFRVLGDDIVISEEQLATKYLEAMQNMGIPISKDKTISSTSFAEFAGKVVSREGAISGLKWREPSDRSFLDVVRLLGPRSLSLLRPRQKRVADVISILPSPEGFGWNPHGIPLTTRLKVLQVWNELTNEAERVYYPMERRWNRIYRGLQQPCFRLRFDHVPVGSWRDIPSGKASVSYSREPTPVGSGMHLLSISEMTGSNLKLPESLITPNLKRELKRRGFTSVTSSTDPRGMNPLDDLEMKLTKLRFNLEQQGIDFPGS